MGPHPAGYLQGAPWHPTSPTLPPGGLRPPLEVARGGGRRVTAHVVTDFLSSFFARWGLLNTITMDNGPPFLSGNFAAFVEERGINTSAHRFTTLKQMGRVAESVSKEQD